LTGDLKFKTRPLESRNRARELRDRFYRDLMRAREDGKLLISAGMRVPYELVAGFGDFECLNEHFSNTVSLDQEVAQRYNEAFEARGFARDFCALSRLYLGAMYSGETPWGPFPRPDMCFMFHACDIQGKWFQMVAEHFAVPYFCLEQPVAYPPNPAKRQHNIRYLADQFHAFIDWGEQVLGRNFDEGRCIEAALNSLEVQSLWAEVCCLNRAVPAPLDDRSLYALESIACLMRHKPEAVDFYRNLRDEVRERVQDGIAALPAERYRLMHDNQPPFYWLGIYKVAEQYGAVAIGSHTSFTLMGAYEDGDDGRLRSRRHPRERGLTFKGRGDLVPYLAEWYADTPFYEDIITPQTRVTNTLRFVEEWGVDGVVIHLNRGCEGVTAGALELKLALRERDIPATVYEGNYVDRRDLSQSQVVDTLESFMESQGLKKTNP
jgi:benzoyl-CoA reductase subunit B